MMDGDNRQSQTAQRTERMLGRVMNACEACRAAKLKCQPSSQNGRCQRCVDSRRECVIRTGQRHRTSRLARNAASREPPKVQDKTTKTFTIDFQLPVQEDLDHDFQDLRDSHSRIFDDLFDTGPSSSDGLSTTARTEAISSPQSKSVTSIGTAPQFNLESAEGLLPVFHRMLEYFPCVLIPRDTDVASLARERPFVLLAMLATAASSSGRTGHNLYDEEFRKILGLKYVASGERSLELLQGLLIYCAWYPFHLRPKPDNSFQYVRMLLDLIVDLGLDKDPSLASSTALESENSVEGHRTYLASLYLLLLLSSTWPKFSRLGIKFTPSISASMDSLERQSSYPADIVLCKQLHLARMLSHAAKVTADKDYRERGDEGEAARLMMLGIQGELEAFHSSLPSDISSTVPIIFDTLFTQIFLYGAGLVQVYTSQTFNKHMLDLKQEYLPLAIPLLTKFFDLISNLDLSLFSSAQWSKFVVSIIIAFRMSFPIKDMPTWDHAQVRSQLNLDQHLLRLSDGYEAISSTLSSTSSTSRSATQTPNPISLSGRDPASASRVVLSVMKSKYDARLARLQRDSIRPSGTGCPMLDGSFAPYYTSWEDTPFDIPVLQKNYANPMVGETDGRSMVTNTGITSMSVFPNLWEEMTLSWATDDLQNPS